MPMLLVNMVNLSFYQRRFMHVECRCAIFWKHSKFGMMRCRKCSFVLIDIKVRILLTFLASKRHLKGAGPNNH